MTNEAVPHEESDRTPGLNDAQVSRAQRLREAGLVVAMGGVALLVWAAIAAFTSPLVLPSPLVVAQALIEVFASGDILKHMGVTLLEILLGFALGSVVGLSLGIALAWSPLVQRLVNPYLVASQAMPKLALAPIFTLWFGFGILPKVVIAGLIAFFPLLENTVVGLRSVEHDKVLLFRSLAANEFQVFVKLRLPSARPYIFVGLRVAMLFATVGAIVGEYVGADIGLGAVIIVANGTMHTALMFAVIILLTVLGVVLYKCVEWSEWLFQRGRIGRFRSRLLSIVRSGARIRRPVG